MDPAHYAVKALSPDLESTIGRELRENLCIAADGRASLSLMTLTADQPFMPKYFGS